MSHKKKKSRSVQEVPSPSQLNPYLKGPKTIIYARIPVPVKMALKAKGYNISELVRSLIMDFYKKN